MNNSLAFIVENEESALGVLSELAGLRTALVELVEAQHETDLDCRTEVEDLAATFVEAELKACTLTEAAEKTCNDLLLTIEDRDKYMKQIESLRIMRASVVELIELDKHVCNLQTLVNVELELDVQNIYKIAKELIILQDLISRSSVTLRSQCMEVYQTIIRHLYEIKIQLKDKIEALWDTNVVIDRMGKNPFYNYNYPDKNRDLIPTSKNISFNFDLPILKELIYLMFQIELGYKHIKSIMHFICQELIYPNIENFQTFCLSATLVNSKILMSLNSIEIDATSSLTDQANTFLDNLTNTLRNIYENFLCIAHTDENDLQRNNLIIGIQKEYFDQFLTKALFETFFPKIIDEHQQLSAKLYEFNDFLIRYKFIHHNNVMIKDYLDNFDTNNNKSEASEMMSCSRNHCLKSILVFSDKVEIESNMSGNSDYDDLEQEVANFNKYIDLQTLKFPKCNVSQLVIELVDTVNNFVKYLYLMHEDDIEKSSDAVCILPDVLMMYLTVVPISNQDALRDIPQAAAIHYNNCMYIAHSCMLMIPALKGIVDQKMTRFNPDNHCDKIRLNSVPESLLILIYTMRNAASETLMIECNKQKEELNEFLSEIETFVNIGSTENKAKLEKVYKKCHLYLLSLSQAYVVLPERIYGAFFGGVLLNYVLSNIFDKVLSMTDIVVSDNKEIVMSIITFQTKLLSIISEYYRIQDPSHPDQKEAESFMVEHVSNWEKMKSLLFVLNANLMEIEDQYLDGKGPLSLHFSGHQLKVLIKALFKHGPLRTKVLDNIH